MQSTHALAALALLLPHAACAVHDVRALAAPAPAPQDDAPPPTPQDDDPPPQGLAEANAHFHAGRWKEAIAAYDEVLAADPSLGVAWFRLGYALHAAGKLERAREVHAKAAEFPEHAPTATYNLGCAHALLGQPDEAFAALDRAITLGFDALGQLDGDADLASLRGDPRWAELRARLAATAEDEPARRQLDFWVGEWGVTSASGQTLGTNRITSQLEGHLIFEEWTGAAGATGKSMNYWDRDARQWKQVWISSGGTVLQMAGTFQPDADGTGGAMRFLGAAMIKNGATVDHKMTLTPLADGRVRQLIEESPDGGATWQATFDGTYTRRAR